MACNTVKLEPPRIAGPADCWCSTDLQMTHFSYQWTIKDFEYRCIDDKEEVILESPQFSCGPETRLLQWQLKLTVGKYMLQGYVVIQLCMISGPGSQIVSRANQQKGDLKVRQIFLT